MSLLGGGNVGRQPTKRSGFQGAVAGASNVVAKPKMQRRPIDIAKLRNIQSGKKMGLDSYKLNANGKSRFRLVMPLGEDTVPLVGANRHWLPYMTDDGKDSKRPFYCYEQFGLPCPICLLRTMLLGALDENLKADADTLRPNNLWAAYIINRDYLVGADDPIAAQNDMQDKVVLFNTMSPKIADSIISYLEMRVWGDASDPDTGYDFEVEGKPTSKIFNGYKVSDYTLTPYPRDYSPSYRLDILSRLRPLSEVITYSKVDDLRKVLDPILVSLSEESEEGAEIISKFQPEYERALLQINAGPDVRIPDEDYEASEIAEITSEVGDDEDDTHEAESQSGRQSEGADPNNSEIGEAQHDEGQGGSEDSEPSPAVPDGELNPEPWNGESFGGDSLPKVGSSTLIGKLQSVGRKGK